jgi:hypothetical protein
MPVVAHAPLLQDVVLHRPALHAAFDQLRARASDGEVGKSGDLAA